MDAGQKTENWIGLKQLEKWTQYESQRAMLFFGILDHFTSGFWNSSCFVQGDQACGEWGTFDKPHWETKSDLMSECSLLLPTRFALPAKSKWLPWKMSVKSFYDSDSGDLFIKITTCKVILIPIKTASSWTETETYQFIYDLLTAAMWEIRLLNWSHDR